MTIRCHSCGAANPDTKTIDEGIGPYEYFGATGVHTAWVDVTECCEAEFSDMDSSEALTTLQEITYTALGEMRTESPAAFIYPHVSDAMLKEAVAAWLRGDAKAGELFAAACEKGFEDAVDYLDTLDTLEGLENE